MVELKYILITYFPPTLFFAFIYSTNFGTNATTPNISPTAFLVDRCENVYVSGWGGSTNAGFPNSGTNGLTEVNQIPLLPAFVQYCKALKTK